MRGGNWWGEKISLRRGNWAGKKFFFIYFPDQRWGKLQWGNGVITEIEFHLFMPTYGCGMSANLAEDLGFGSAE